MTQQNPSPAAVEANPFFETWTAAFEVPPFARIAPEHFMPAFERAFADNDAEIAAVTAQAEAPTFGNTIEALERSGKLLDRVSGVFFNLASADTNDALLAIEREIGPKLAAHSNRILQNDALFQRIDTLYRARDTAGLTAEQRRVLDRYHKMYRRAGAGLDVATKARLAEIAQRLATVGTSFSQNVLADEQDYTLTLDTEEDLAGLPDFVRAAAQAAANERGKVGKDSPGKHVITLSRSSVEPFLQFSARRDLREKAFRAWIARGDNGGATDNKAAIAETVALRAERAKLLGYETYAHYRLDDAMAKTPDAVRDLLDRVWTPARAGALADRDAMQELVRQEGGNFTIAPWDWRYYAEKLRKVRCDIDEATVKPYFQLHHIIDAAFYTAYKLFGLSFERRKDVATWHPDVMVWEVTGPDGRHLGLFFGDYFARQSKRSGAWMTTLRDQQKLTGDVRPLVINIMNFNKAAEGSPTLLSFDDARTLFHEFGHGLHGLLSDVTYPMVAGTSVLTDWVELPSQLYEHWLEQPDILRRFAIHARTGRPIPDDLLKRLLDARNFNRGFTTVEFVASALFDLDAHLLKDTEGFDVGAFEEAELAKMNMPPEIVMRHRPTHFAHVFSGGGYASAYYSYMWSEVLDADAFAAFQETGDIFDPATAKKLHDHVYSAGGRSDPEALYLEFRGRLPTADALLKQRGFAPATT
ncbi:MAG TPA: M3 family metallopeptidase [Xanthobacteraceae bacterium]|nr:M3 family metallopeptidase [Xanthobacteraceae bacterium]